MRNVHAVSQKHITITKLIYTVSIKQVTQNLGDFANHKLNKRLSEQFSACV